MPTTICLSLPFAVHDKKMLARVKELSKEHTLYFPDVPVVGDRIMYDKYAGTQVKLDGEDYLILRMSDVIAVIE